MHKPTEIEKELLPPLEVAKKFIGKFGNDTVKACELRPTSNPQMVQLFDVSGNFAGCCIEVSSGEPLRLAVRQYQLVDGQWKPVGGPQIYKWSECFPNDQGCEKEIDGHSTARRLPKVRIVGAFALAAAIAAAALGIIRHHSSDGAAPAPVGISSSPGRSVPESLEMKLANLIEKRYEPFRKIIEGTGNVHHAVIGPELSFRGIRRDGQSLTIMLNFPDHSFWEPTNEEEMFCDSEGRPICLEVLLEGIVSLVYKETYPDQAFPPQSLGIEFYGEAGLACQIPPISASEFNGFMRSGRAEWGGNMLGRIIKPL